jgi:starvation-inducible DNA-binding protein
METKKQKMVPTAVEIPVAKRTKLAEILNQTLADMADLKTHAKQAHWNIQGSQFVVYHKLFDKVAEEADSSADLVAERCSQLGGFVNGLLLDAAKNTSLKAFPEKITADIDCLEAVLDSVSQVCASCRGNIEEAEFLGDYVTSDIYIDITRAFDKLLWMLKASSL